MIRATAEQDSINYRTSAFAEFSLTIEENVQWEADKIVFDNAAVVLSAETFKYNGKTQRPVVKTIGGKAVTEGVDYTAQWYNSSSVNPGTYTVTLIGKGRCFGTTKANYQIEKAPNPMSAKGKTVKVKYKDLKKKSKKLAVNKVMTITGAQGKVSYKLISVKKTAFLRYIKLSKKTGKVTIRKNAKKGTYKIKVNVTAAGNANYESMTKKITFKIIVK